MKRIFSLLLCILLMGGVFVPAFGAEMEEAPDASLGTASVETVPEGQSDAIETDFDSGFGVTLQIDGKNAYDGMSKAYQSGYVPTVSGSTAVLVLPLKADGALKNNQLTASLELGDAASSPFVYKNYYKTFSLEEKAVNGSKKTEEIYYIRFDLSLSADRYNGVYPVIVSVNAQDTSGNPVSQSFTLYVTITNGKDPDAEEDAPEQEPAPSSEPVVLVTGSALTPSEVLAGEAFTASVTLHNTSEEKAVRNMVVTVNCDSTDFTLLNDSDTIYISKLGAGESTTVELEYQVGLNTPEGQYRLNLSMTYDNSDAVTLSSSGSVSIPVKQSCRVELNMPAVADSVNAGDTLPLSFQVLNLGRSKIYNVRCDVSGYGLFPTGTAFIGDMEPGTEGEALLNLFIGSKSLSDGYTGTEQYGKTTGTVTLTYETADGTEYTEEAVFTTNIEKLEIVSNQEEEPEKSASQWWISVAICAGILILAGGVVLLRRWMKKHEAV